MDGAEEMVPIILSVSLFATILGVVYIRSRENMALIERGINPKTIRPAGPRASVNLRYGLLLSGAALGLLIAFLIDISMNHRDILPGGEVYNRDYPQIYFALIGLGGGLGLVISYLIERKEWQHRHGPDSDKQA